MNKDKGGPPKLDDHDGLVAAKRTLADLQTELSERERTSSDLTARFRGQRLADEVETAARELLGDAGTTAAAVEAVAAEDLGTAQRKVHVARRAIEMQRKVIERETDEASRLYMSHPQTRKQLAAHSDRMGNAQIELCKSMEAFGDLTARFDRDGVKWTSFTRMRVYSGYDRLADALFTGNPPIPFLRDLENGDEIIARLAKELGVKLPRVGTKQATRRELQAGRVVEV